MVLMWHNPSPEPRVVVKPLVKRNLPAFSLTPFPLSATRTCRLFLTTLKSNVIKLASAFTELLIKLSIIMEISNGLKSVTKSILLLWNLHPKPLGGFPNKVSTYCVM